MSTTLLQNPAYVAALIHRSMNESPSGHSRRLPVLLLVAPLCLHLPTARLICASATIQDFRPPEVYDAIHERCRRMTSLSLHAIDLLLASGVLRRAGGGAFACVIREWGEVDREPDVSTLAARKYGAWCDSASAAEVMVACLGLPPVKEGRN